MISVRVLTGDDWQLFREVRLEALHEAPYAFGSTVRDWQGERDSEERWRRRLTEVPFNVIAYVDADPVGIASGTSPNEDGAAELISMWVAPFARGQGIADALVDAVVRWASEENVEELSADVMEDNDRARAFFARRGFADRGRIEMPRGERQERRMRLTLGR